MYPTDDLEKISKIRQSLKEQYKKRRTLRHKLYRHGVGLRWRVGTYIPFIPLCLEIYFFQTFGFSFLITLPLYYSYWNYKTMFCDDMNRQADEIRLDIIMQETGLRKKHNLVYESFNDYLFRSADRRRFSVRSNVFFDDVVSDVSDREINEDWL